MSRIMAAHEGYKSLLINKLYMNLEYREIHG